MIANKGSRTGAPMLLLNYLKWMQPHADFKLIMIFQEGGELIPEYEQLGEVYMWDDIITLGTANKRLRSLLFRVGKKITGTNDKTLCNLFLKKLKRKYRIKLVYSNTTTNGHILSCIKNTIGCKILTHVHEGEKTLMKYDHDGLVSYSLQASDKLIAVSETVKKVLVEKFKVGQCVTVIPGALNEKQKPSNDGKLLKRSLGIPDDALVIMSCGWLGWHKGTDLFIQIARSLSSYKDKQLHFVWLGGHEWDDDYAHMMYDIEKLNLTNYVTLVTNKKNPQDYIAFSDIFLMLSRDESFSLVTIEAGLASKPVLCFEGGGGPCEIVANDPRSIVEYANLDALKKRLIELVENENERRQMGEYLFKRVVENYTLDKTSKVLLQEINSQIHNHKSEV